MLADYGLIEERRCLLDDQQALTDEAGAILDRPNPDADVLSDIWAQSLDIDKRVESLSVAIFAQRMGWAS